jgi:SAM-dependent methyltransferase
MWDRGRRALPFVLHGKFTRGWCPVCDKRTLFVQEGPRMRDQWLCARCRSIPRWRAMAVVLEQRFPAWRELSIHESSPGGSTSDKLARECPRYTPTFFYSGVPRGSLVRGTRCEDLEQQTFADGSFDLVITQDVFEHVLDPARGFREVARTLRPGGAHVFTLPWYPGHETRVRAVREHGTVRHLCEPDYHCDPIDPTGSLVVTDWGRGLVDFIAEHGGLTTEVVCLQDRRLGIDGDLREVFISRKAGGDASAGRT